jgi:hypothetical protein
LSIKRKSSSIEVSAKKLRDRGIIDHEFGLEMESQVQAHPNWLSVEAMADVKDLLTPDYLKPIRCDIDVIACLVAPFLAFSPDEWPIESKRVDIITQLEIEDYLPVLSADIKHFFSDSLPEYLTKYKSVAEDCIRRDEPTVHVNKIYSTIKLWYHLEIYQLSDQQINECISILQGRISIDGRGAEQGALDAWFEFAPKWQRFLDENPKYARIMDPFWVVINVLGVVPPPNLNAAIAAYPLAGSQAPHLHPGLNGSNYYFGFGSQADARHFAGYVSRTSGINCWETSTSTNPPIYL